MIKAKRMIASVDCGVLTGSSITELSGATGEFYIFIWMVVAWYRHVKIHQASYLVHWTLYLFYTSREK